MIDCGSANDCCTFPILILLRLNPDIHLLYTVVDVPAAPVLPRAQVLAGHSGKRAKRADRRQAGTYLSTSWREPRLFRPPGPCLSTGLAP